MDVHEAQFASCAFSIMSLVNSLPVPASQLHVFVEAAAGCSVCVRPAYALTPSGRRTDAVTDYTHSSARRMFKNTQLHM